MVNLTLKHVASIVRETNSGVLIDVQVSPGARTTCVKTINTWRKRLELAVKEQAQKGQANQAVIELMASLLGLPKANVSISSGETGSQKTILATGLQKEKVMMAIGLALGICEE